MGGLLSSLNLGGGALLADQAGVAVSGRNTANVNTKGYSRESVTLQAQQAAPLVGGVLASNAQRASDSLLASQERTQAGQSGMAQTLSSSLSGLEQSLTSADVPSALGQFYGAINQLQASPTDPGLRNQVLQNAQTVAQQFNAASQAISQSQSDADAQMGTMATQATQLMQQIASLNSAMQSSNDPVLADQRDSAAKQLAGLVGGQGVVEANGQMNFTLGNGAVLVDGTHAAQLVTTPDAARGGHVDIKVVDGATTRDVTSSLDGGSMAALVSFRDGTAATAAQNLDQLANDFATQLNAVHSANQGLDGSTGNNLFSGVTGTVAGSAAHISVNAALLANPNKLATGAVGAGVNDNSGVASLLATRDQALAGGGTRSFTDQALYVSSQVGSDAANAANNATLQSSKDSTLAAMRDSVSGVDINEEAATLASFQHAAEAATQFISTVNSLLETIITQL